MKKVQINQILVKNTNLSSVKLDETDETIIALIRETKQKQADVLMLKKINYNSLNKIINI